MCGPVYRILQYSRNKQTDLSAAFLTVSRLADPIDSPSDLAKQDLSSATSIRYGIQNNSASSTFFFSRSSDRVYQQMWNDMNRYGMMMANAQEGYERVRNESYAFMHSKSGVNYENARAPCNTKTVGMPLYSDRYALALAFSAADLRHNLSNAILTLGENNILRDMEARWFSRGLNGNYSLQIFFCSFFPDLIRNYYKMTNSVHKTIN